MWVRVRPLQITGAHTCACAPKSGRARCVRATQKTVATHTLLMVHPVVHFLNLTNFSLAPLCCPLLESQLSMAAIGHKVKRYRFDLKCYQDRHKIRKKKCQLGPFIHQKNFISKVFNLMYILIIVTSLEQLSVAEFSGE